MQKLFTGLGLGIAVIVTSTAVYADGMPSRGRVVAAAPTCAHFGGFYVGAHGAWNYWTGPRNDQDGYLVDNAGFTLSDDSFGGGAQVGYNIQTRGRCTLWGIEGDFSWTRLNASINQFQGAAAGNDHSIRSNIDWISTIRTRGGIVVENTLLYLTGGVAFADIETRVRHAHVPPVAIFAEQHTFSDTQVGMVAGAGMEIALGSNISLKSEVLYMNFGDWNRSVTGSVAHFGAPPANQFRFSGNDEIWSTRTGLNFRF